MATTPFNVKEIISLLTEMYNLILRTQSLPEVSIIQGPHSSPLFDANAWTNTGMDPNTVLVLSKLPFFSSNKHNIGPDMAPMPYLRDERRSNFDEEEENEEEDEEEDEEDENLLHLDSWTNPFVLDNTTGYIEPWCIPLTSAAHGGFILILDCKTNEIFEVDWFSARSDLPEAPPDTNNGYYRHFPSGIAPDILKKWIGYYRSLFVVPDFTQGNWWFGDDGEMGGEEEGKETRQLLLDHGWPDNFGEEEFAAALGPWKEAKYAKGVEELEAEQAKLKKDAREWAQRTYGDAE